MLMWAYEQRIHWFKPYLCGGGQRIAVQGTMTCKLDLDCGVPQGSCLGPLFVNCTSNLVKTLENHLPKYMNCFFRG